MSEIDTVDVIVVGYGFAGAATALTAREEGASVLILEKMPHGGGNSRVSGGNCVIANDNDEDAAGFVEYLDRLCFGTTGRPVIEALVRESRSLPAWFAELGSSLTVPDQLIVANTYPRTIKGPGFPAAPGGIGTFAKYCVPGPADVPPSRRMWEFLSAKVADAGVEVRYNSRVTKLLRDGSGTVIGVRTEDDADAREIRARAGVVLTCGGFENNPEMRTEHLPSTAMKFAGNPGNTGDGNRLVQEIGGDIWHMGRTSCIIGHQTDEFEAAFGIFFPAPGFIYVDQYGKRFVDETGIELHEFYRSLSEFDTERVEYPRIPAWGIFTHSTRLAGPLTWRSSGYNRELYQWSEDNSAEIAKGWIHTADDATQLASTIGTPDLAETVARYNQYCDIGTDLDHRRAPGTLEPLTGRLYAIKLHPTILNTQGGARRDERGSVLDFAGRPIRGLYSAGEFGSIWGFLYQGASNITECLTFGRISGRNVLADARTVTA
ncbi:Fumarate reductase/succinate dehydrogenase flavoprotein domain protein OS=Tsukamurella paurometabola(strain ATCC 8368 / DSM / CCUG 35730 / CIP 100753 /JCM 10117 / KCTC 9821 / NBRC 16120 / NCIMB 702349 / NCTC 13040)OX=521096 GN=Tpau_2702 PE=4 SV=1 [Tsukamurella paurometabola]|uniref:Fumarate reductase/succinate dehydrogenase flavoprotein domain protein n=1 Tax=Tsukamurella paurometabola (strain ATCC 8368 / DSM 20162 / CCUG 35730 / CIP 100753 / JCM 10117 / KCTC 9821 / NBRC 16120 / NCIMB 702349 / NCTC 13040) TaxID=521096 RepID=D5USN0_TSUPD|nr:FAD-dependent oxidoreductase [Tsukamurella paurometabola]ADG79301.1 fumarate reductase/succinate dehydrogenase flavoprotein domain protein [Tsukamurella paurometabola DSM 20162]SUP34985.1 Fumarate reductase flavoprotein subunit precursor [Tsukamurella paurometabola]